MNKVDRMASSRWKYAVITGFLGSLKDRFITYDRPRDIAAKLELAAGIEGCTGVELIYPHDFGDPGLVKRGLATHGLGVAAVNLNVKADEEWRFGSFTNSDASIRARAVQRMKEAMDAAADLGCNLVTSAFLNDGADYPFETDWPSALAWTVEGVAEAAAHRGDVRVALEYKASEPRAHCLIGNAGTALTVAQMTGRDNVGVNVDIGHSLQAQEVPAAAIALCAAANRLFYIHINDNYRNWDWDLVPGTANWWDYLELVFQLRRSGYSGWLTADVFPGRHDPVRVMEKTFEWMARCVCAVEQLDETRIVELMHSADAFAVLDEVRKTMGR